MRFTDDLNGLPLEYQRMNGTAFRDLDVSDLINNPGANGVCSVLSLSFGEQASDLILRDLRALGDDVPNPLLVRENPVQALTSAYGNSGDSREKAIRFLLAALAYLEIQVSPLFTKAARAGNGTIPGALRRRRPRQKPDPGSKPAPSQPPAPTVGTSRVITLKSGGTLTVSASIDLFKLSPKDRAFVFSLIDKLESYELGDGQGDE